MTRDEFIKLTVSSGYATQKEAEEYCGDKKYFDGEDFIKVFHSSDNSKFSGKRVRNRGLAGVFSKTYGRTTAGCGWHHAG